MIVEGGPLLRLKSGAHSMPGVPPCIEQMRTDCFGIQEANFASLSFQLALMIKARVHLADFTKPRDSHAHWLSPSMYAAQHVRAYITGKHKCPGRTSWERSPTGSLSPFAILRPGGHFPAKHCQSLPGDKGLMPQSRGQPSYETPTMLFYAFPSVIWYFMNR